MLSEDKYTDPELHDQVEEEIKESNKGGAPGQWSARKAQVMAQEYEERGGSYTTDKEIHQDDSESEEEEDEEDIDADGADEDEEGDEDYEEDGNEEEDEGEDNDNTNENDDEENANGRKRRRPMKYDTSKFKKKQKSNSGQAKQTKQINGKNGSYGSKHDNPDAPAPQGSNSRLPKEGQRISWKAMPGWVHGKVLEVVTEEKEMQGKHIKASKEDPRIAIEADSGKFCVHKPDNCYFEDN